MSEPKDQKDGRIEKDKKALRIKITDDADMHMNQCGFQKHMIYIVRVAQK